MQWDRNGLKRVPQAGGTGLLRRRVVAAALASMATPGLARADAPGSNWARILQSGTLRVGLIENWHPYSWSDDGRDQGFLIRMGRDLTQALAARMGQPLALVHVVSTWPAAVLDLQRDRFDVFFGLSYSAERATALNLFGPLYQLPQVVLRRRGAGRPATWASYDDPGIRVAVVLGSIDEQIARRRLASAQILALPGVSEAVLAVQSGTALAMVTTLLTGMGAAKALDGAVLAEVITPLEVQASYGGSRHGGDGRLEAFLREWADTYRQSGRSRMAILEALRQDGMDADGVPAGVAF